MALVMRSTACHRPPACALTLQAHKHDHVGLALSQVSPLGVTAAAIQHGAQLVKHRLLVGRQGKGGQQGVGDSRLGGRCLAGSKAAQAT